MRVCMARSTVWILSKFTTFLCNLFYFKLLASCRVRTTHHNFSFFFFSFFMLSLRAMNVCLLLLFFVSRSCSGVSLLYIVCIFVGMAHLMCDLLCHTAFWSEKKKYMHSRREEQQEREKEWGECVCVLNWKCQRENSEKMVGIPRRRHLRHNYMSVKMPKSEKYIFFM